MTDSHSERGTGRTTRMIMALPEEGAIVLVPHHRIRDQVRHEIVKHRGSDFLKKCNLVVLREARDFDQLRGLRRDIAVRWDHTLTEAYWRSEMAQRFDEVMARHGEPRP